MGWFDMTKKELKRLMEEFISRQDNYDKDEWYGTRQEFVADVLTDFACDLNIDLNGDVSNG